MDPSKDATARQCLPSRPEEDLGRIRQVRSGTAALRLRSLMKTTPRSLAQSKHSSVFVKPGSFEYEPLSNSGQVKLTAADFDHDSRTTTHNRNDRSWNLHSAAFRIPSTNAWLTACLGNTTQLRGRLTHFFFLDAEETNEVKIGSQTCRAALPFCCHHNRRRCFLSAGMEVQQKSGGTKSRTCSPPHQRRVTRPAWLLAWTLYKMCYK